MSAFTPRLRKAVLPATGRGLRYAPATKAVPKEMLPLVDKPIIEYLVEELAEAGIEDVLMVTGRGSVAIEDYFDAAPELEAALEKQGDPSRLAAVRRSSALARTHFARADADAGTGEAVLRARDHVDGEPFVVALADDVIGEDETLLVDLVAAQEALGGSVLALAEVEPDELETVAATVEPTEVTVRDVPIDDVVTVRDLVTGPPAEPGVRHLVPLGRMVLTPAVFAALEQQGPGNGGSVDLTDALRALTATDADGGGGLHGVVFRGVRHRTSDKLDYLKAVVALAADRDDLGADFSAWLSRWVEGRHVELSSRPDGEAPRPPAAP